MVEGVVRGAFPALTRPESPVFADPPAPCCIRGARAWDYPKSPVNHILYTENTCVPNRIVY